MTVMDTADKPGGDPAEPAPVRAADLSRQRRNRNLALLVALLAFVVLIYVLSVVKMGGG